MSNSTLTEIGVALLRAKNRESEQAIASLKRDKMLSMKLALLPVVLFIRHPIVWLKRFYLSWKHRGFIKNFNTHSERFRQFVFAVSSLKRGNYELAIRALNFLIKQTPASFPTEFTSSETFNLMEKMPNPNFRKLVQMRNQLFELQFMKQGANNED